MESRATLGNKISYFMWLEGAGEAETVESFSFKKKKGIATKHHFFFNNKTALRKEEKLQELALEPDPRNDCTSL